MNGGSEIEKKDEQDMKLRIKGAPLLRDSKIAIQRYAAAIFPGHLLNCWYTYSYHRVGIKQL